MLGVCQINIGNNIHDAAVGFLRQALILTAVAGFHVENGNMQPLGRNGRQAGVGIAQNQHGIGLGSRHELVRAVDNIAHGGAQIITNRIHIDIRIGKTEIPEENSI